MTLLAGGELLGAGVVPIGALGRPPHTCQGGTCHVGIMIPQSGILHALNRLRPSCL